MYGATARPTSRHASSRSPSTPRSRTPAASSPAFQALASAHGCSASTVLFAPPTNSHSSASASCSSMPSSRSANGRRVSSQPSASGDSPSRARRGPLAVEVAVGHRHGPVEQVPEVVGEVGVVAPHERVPRHLGVAIERDLAQHDVARPVLAERRDEVVRVEEVAAALAHPLAAGRQQPAVDPDVARRLEAGAPQHRRPEDRVEACDVLADDVQVGRPPALERVQVVREAGARDVVDEGVEPDVDRCRPPGPTSRPRAGRSSRPRRSGTGCPSRRACARARSRSPRGHRG